MPTRRIVPAANSARSRFAPRDDDAGEYIRISPKLARHNPLARPHVGAASSGRCGAREKRRSLPPKPAFHKLRLEHEATPCATNPIGSSAAHLNEKGAALPILSNASTALSCDPDIRDAFAYDEMLRAAVDAA